jgi:hypothetical protein
MGRQAVRGFAVAGLCLVLAASGGVWAQGTAGADAPGREACAGLARSLKDMEVGGMRDYLARDPATVEAGARARVRDYIALRETVLFRCPPYVLNATAAPLAERLAKVPPPPGKGPKLVVRRAPVLAPGGGIPLPVRRPI